MWHRRRKLNKRARWVLHYNIVCTPLFKWMTQEARPVLHILLTMPTALTYMTRMKSVERSKLALTKYEKLYNFTIWTHLKKSKREDGSRRAQKTSKTNKKTEVEMTWLNTLFSYRHFNFHVCFYEKTEKALKNGWVVDVSF